MNGIYDSKTETEPSTPITPDDFMRDIQIETKNKVYFELQRNSLSYIIEIVENMQAPNKRFNIVVTRIDDPTDRDYLSISQITMFYSEI